MRTRWMKVNLLLVPLVSLGLIGATAATASASPVATSKTMTYQQATHEIAARGAGLTLTAAQLGSLHAALLHPGAAAHVDSTHRACIRIYRWEIEDYGWLLTVGFAQVEIAGIILDATGVAIPAGVILNALGIEGVVSGAYIIWWADNRFPSSRTFCLTWT